MAALQAAYEAVVASIHTIPDRALDWPPGGADWSLKSIVGHLAHANDFYLMIIDEACATDGRNITLRPEIAGYQAMVATDAAVARCTTTAEALVCFEHTYAQLLHRLHTLSSEQLDQPFTIAYTWQPETAPEMTTLRQRVVEMATNHVWDHLDQLEVTLTRWQAAHPAHPDDASRA